MDKKLLKKSYGFWVVSYQWISTLWLDSVYINGGNSSRLLYLGFRKRS